MLVCLNVRGHAAADIPVCRCVASNIEGDQHVCAPSPLSLCATACDPLCPCGVISPDRIHPQRHKDSVCTENIQDYPGAKLFSLSACFHLSPRLELAPRRPTRARYLFLSVGKFV